MRADSVVVVVIVPGVAEVVPFSVVYVVVRIPAIVVPIVVVPVVRTPGIPVGRVVAPVPGRAPGHIAGKVYVPYQRPGFNHYCGGPYRDDLPLSAYIARVGSLCIILVVDGFNYVVLPIQCPVPDQLYLNCPVTELLNGKYCYILFLILVYCHLQNDSMYISINIINHHNVVDQIVTVQVEIIDP